jgi:hypothetical protein
MFTCSSSKHVKLVPPAALCSSFPTSTAVPTEHWLDTVDTKYYCDDDDDDDVVVVVDDDDDAVLLGSRTCGN